MTVGPAYFGEDIIAMVLEDACGGYQREDGEWRIAAEIGEHQEGNVDLAQYFDVEYFFYRAGEDMDDNREGSDEDGNRHPLDPSADADQTGLDIEFAPPSVSGRKNRSCRCARTGSPSRNVEMSTCRTPAQTT